MRTSQKTLIVTAFFLTVLTSAAQSAGHIHYGQLPAFTGEYTLVPSSSHYRLAPAQTQSQSQYGAVPVRPRDEQIFATIPAFVGEADNPTFNNTNYHSWPSDDPPTVDTTSVPSDDPTTIDTTSIPSDGPTTIDTTSIPPDGPTPNMSDHNAMVAINNIIKNYEVLRGMNSTTVQDQYRKDRERAQRFGVYYDPIFMAKKYDKAQLEKIAKIFDANDSDYGTELAQQHRIDFKNYNTELFKHNQGIDKEVGKHETARDTQGHHQGTDPATDDDIREEQR